MKLAKPLIILTVLLSLPGLLRSFVSGGFTSGLEATTSTAGCGTSGGFDLGSGVK